jgi:hypothetical protein
VSKSTRRGSWQERSLNRANDLSFSKKKLVILTFSKLFPNFSPKFRSPKCQTMVFLPMYAACQQDFYLILLVLGSLLVRRLLALAPARARHRCLQHNSSWQEQEPRAMHSVSTLAVALRVALLDVLPLRSSRLHAWRICIAALKPSDSLSASVTCHHRGTITFLP